MSSFLEKLAQSTDAVLAIASMLLAMVAGYLVSRLALHASMRRIGWPSRGFSPNPASVMIGLLFVPLVLFVYIVSKTSSLAPLDRLFAALLSICLVTAPIVFVLAPLFALYLYSVASGAAISDRSIYVLSVLCFGGQIFWLMTVVAGME